MSYNRAVKCPKIHKLVVPPGKMTQREYIHLMIDAEQYGNIGRLVVDKKEAKTQRETSNDLGFE